MRRLTRRSTTALIAGGVAAALVAVAGSAASADTEHRGPRHASHALLLSIDAGPP